MSCGKMVRKVKKNPNNKIKVEILKREKTSRPHCRVFMYSSYRSIFRYMWESAYKIFLINSLMFLRHEARSYLACFGMAWCVQASPGVAVRACNLFCLVLEQYSRAAQLHLAVINC